MASNRRCQEQQGGPGGPRIIGGSAPIRALLAQIERVAPTEATVLILGERGTGKELVARALQRASRRRDRPFVAVNCAALPGDLLASELFGHERGAFTGAHERRPGLLAPAKGGTLFLDEVGDLSLAGQAMLLRVLQEREVRPVGSAETVPVDVRVIAATNKDLEAAIQQREFRADLYDRLSEVLLEVPPLRDRRDDILLLAEHFLVLHARRHGLPRRRLTSGALRTLRAHNWPGNVRELEQTLSRAAIFGGGGSIRLRDLGLLRSPATTPADGGDPAGPDPASFPLTPRQHAIARAAERRGALRTRDVVAQLGVSRQTARRDLRRLIDAGLLRASGRRRGMRYEPA